MAVPAMLPSRMKLLVQILEVFAGDVGVYLSRRNIHMTEHYLHGSQIGAAFKQMGCKRMPQTVGRNFFMDLRLIGVAPQQFPKPLSGDGFARPGDEQVGAGLIF